MNVVLGESIGGEGRGGQGEDGGGCKTRESHSFAMSAATATAGVPRESISSLTAR